jgi:hypothetical protein
MVYLGLYGVAALADPFDPPEAGRWRCSDGTFTHGNGGGCRPREFQGEWWLTCVPGRTDCIVSETSFMGWDITNPRGQWVQRGHGYCYTEQPFTCSPDGTLP